MLVMNKLEVVDNLWIPFIVQPQSDVVAFAMTNFRYIQLKKRKNWIGPNDMIKLNNEIENLSNSIIKLSNINGRSNPFLSQGLTPKSLSLLVLSQTQTVFISHYGVLKTSP